MHTTVRSTSSIQNQNLVSHEIMGTIIPTNFSPIEIEYPTNGQWTIYGHNGSYIYAQPHSIPYPLFVPLLTCGSIIEQIGLDAVPSGFIHNSLHTKAICYQQLLKLLTSISQDKDYPFEQEYRSIPFNDSHINILKKWGKEGNGKGVESGIYRGSKFENSTLSVVVLRNLWGFGREDCRKELETGIGMPAVMPLTKLQVRAWLHDTVFLVSISGHDDSTLYAFKTNQSSQVLYQEIHTLLSMPPHPNILERPSYLISKQTAYSVQHPLDPASLYCLEPTEPVVGFLTPYYSGGSLKNYVKNHEITLKQKAKWALQLTSALLHIYEYGGGNGKCGRYSALKMDNIVLDAAGNLRLIDFEMAGTRVQYTPIEVMMASQRGGRISRFMGGSSDSGTTRDLGGKCKVCSPHPCSVPKDMTGQESQVHEKVLEYKLSQTSIISPSKPNSNAQYTGPSDHKKIPFWGDASDAECGAAMTWMLGCCLWCIFEDVPCLTGMGSDWFPVGNTLWKKARQSVPVAVLKIVREALQTKADRPTLREIYEVMKGWEGALILEQAENEE
ncbi:hypothetical protein DFP73DRAFT_532996 [Morchella snyderi]|nr:hypothetical protein DFP73DRAFT_532996 [Morchella snyderi]